MDDLLKSFADAERAVNLSIQLRDLLEEVFNSPNGF